MIVGMIDECLDGVGGSAGVGIGRDLVLGCVSSIGYDWFG